MYSYDISLALAAERRKEYEHQAEIHRQLVEAGVFARKTTRVNELFAKTRRLMGLGNRRFHSPSEQVECAA